MPSISPRSSLVSAEKKNKEDREIKMVEHDSREI